MPNRKKKVEPISVSGNGTKTIVRRGLSPIERMIDNYNLKCVKCGAKAGFCDCWTKCPVAGCSWSIEKGHKCRNPNHA